MLVEKGEDNNRSRRGDGIHRMGGSAREGI